MEAKAIFEKSMNAKGEIIDVSYKYIDTDAVYNTLTELFNEKAKEFENDDLHGWFPSEDLIEEYIVMCVRNINNSMRTYLHQDSHKIFGNFNNLDYDYNYYKHAAVSGVYDSDKIGGNDYDLRACIERLDKGEISEEAESDRKALTDWFWNTYGTFGLCYNFTEMLNEDYADYCYSEGIED